MEGKQIFRFDKQGVILKAAPERRLESQVVTEENILGLWALKIILSLFLAPSFSIVYNLQ